MRDLRVSFPRPCDEKWETMAPAGCDRVCARCDKVIHDLSQYQIEEVEALLRSEPDICVRAPIDADGTILLKSRWRGNMRRMVIAFGASAGLLTGEPALARQERPAGTIVGRILTNVSTRVVAKSPDGKSFRGSVKGDGRYTIKHLPAGTYELTFVPSCGDSWKVEAVVVGDGEAVVPESQGSNACIVVGMLRIEGGKG